MKQPLSPCKECTFETGRCIEPNCHDTCEKFLEYKRADAEWKASIDEGRSEEHFNRELKRNRIARARKAQHRRK